MVEHWFREALQKQLVRMPSKSALDAIASGLNQIPASLPSAATLTAKRSALGQAAQQLLRHLPAKVQEQLELAEFEDWNLNEPAGTSGTWHSVRELRVLEQTVRRMMPLLDPKPRILANQPSPQWKRRVVPGWKLAVVRCEQVIRENVRVVDDRRGRRFGKDVLPKVIQPALVAMGQGHHALETIADALRRPPSSWRFGGYFVRHKIPPEL